MKKIVEIIRYYPIAVNLFITAICIEYFLGYDAVSYYLYTFIGQSFAVNILLYFLSVKYKFCLWHRLLIYNMSFALILETLSNYGIVIPFQFFIVSCATGTTFLATILIIIIQWINKTVTQKT